MGDANDRQAMRRFVIPGTCPDTRTPHTQPNFQILGGDVAGIVVQPDAGGAFAPGDRVFAMTKGFKWDIDTNGCYAERVAVPAAAAAKAPTSISLLHAAAVPLVALTAAQTIALAPASALAAGGKALVTAGAG